MPKEIDIKGHKYHELKVLKFLGVNALKKRIWLCQCDCGNKTVVAGESLRSGNTKSCGCRQVRKVILKNKTSATRGGLTNTRTGKCWGAMMNRCKKAPRYIRRRISVCESLKSSPAAIISIIGERPAGRYSLDRINNSIGYYCGSCRECLTKGWPSKESVFKQDHHHKRQINVRHRMG